MAHLFMAQEALSSEKHKLIFSIRGCELTP
jgi:hypothetical protein